MHHLGDLCIIWPTAKKHPSVVLIKLLHEPGKAVYGPPFRRPDRPRANDEQRLMPTNPNLMQKSLGFGLCFLTVGNQRFPVAVFRLYPKGAHDAQNPFDLVSMRVTVRGAVIEKPARTLAKPDTLRNACQHEQECCAEGFMRSNRQGKS